MTTNGISLVVAAAAEGHAQTHDRNRRSADPRGERREWLTVNEAASRMKVSDDCIRQWLRHRKLTRYKLGKLVRIDAEELESLVREDQKTMRA